MPLRVDDYLARRFHPARQNCWHLVRDAWLDLTGVDLLDRTPERVTAESLTQKIEMDAEGFERLDAPTDPCIILMRAEGAVPHVGVYTRGKVLQLSAGGATFLPLEMARAGFGSLEFYR